MMKRIRATVITVVLSVGLSLAMVAGAQTWTTPLTAAGGNVLTDAQWNASVRDNLLVLRAGGVAITSQAAGDVIYASGASQLARLPIGSAGEVLTVNSGGTAPEWSTGLPSGVVLPYGGSSAPSGYLMADGSAVSRTTYAALFAIYGTTFGAGDGSTTFNLPDLRQRFPLGKAASGTGNTLGATGGAIDHTHTYSDLPQHNHSVDPPNTTSTSEGAKNTTFSMGDVQDGAMTRFTNTTDIERGTLSVATADDHTHDVNIGSFNSGNAGVASPETDATNAPYLVLNYIVKV